MDQRKSRHGQHAGRHVAAQEAATQDGPVRWQQDARAAAWAALATLCSGLLLLDGWLAGGYWYGLIPAAVVVAAIAGGRWLAHRALLPRDVTWRHLFWMAVGVGVALLFWAALTN